MNDSYICFYDYETNGKDPTVIDPVQISALIICPRKLEVIDKFASDIRPLDINDEDFAQKYADNIAWHAKNAGCSSEAIVERWKNAPHQKDVWTLFNTFLKKYHKNPLRPTGYTAPIAAGYNICNFDNIITNRLADKYGTKYVFAKIFTIDLMNLVWLFFENNKELDSLSFDSVRNYFGLSSKGAHDAIVDTEQGSEVLIRFLKLIRNVSSRTKMKGAFLNGKV